MTMFVCLSVCICLTARIFLKPHLRSSPIFSCLLPMVVARSSCAGIAIRYVLSVYWWHRICTPIMGNIYCRGANGNSQPAWRCSQPVGQWPRQLGLRAMAGSVRHSFHALFVIRVLVPFSQSLPEWAVRMGTLWASKLKTIPHKLNLLSS